MWYVVSSILIVVLNTNCKPWYCVTILIVNQTFFVIPCTIFGGMIDLHCCNYYHLRSEFSSQMLIIHDNISSQVDDKRG